MHLMEVMNNKFHQLISGTIILLYSIFMCQYFNKEMIDKGVTDLRDHWSKYIIKIKT